jgi:hypothetical protein
VIGDEWIEEEYDEPGVVLPVATQPIIEVPRRKLSLRLVFNDETCAHLREEGRVFTECGVRVLQGLQSGDERRSLPVCAVCAAARDAA